MKCPVCTDISLVTSERQGIEIDSCPQCRGVWLDRGELDALIERALAAMPSDALPHDAPIVPPPPKIPLVGHRSPTRVQTILLSFLNSLFNPEPKPASQFDATAIRAVIERDRVNPIKCPVCTDTSLFTSERQGIEIDNCPQCRGVWLDRGELDKLIELALAAMPSDALPHHAPVVPPPPKIPLVGHHPPNRVQIILLSFLNSHFNAEPEPASQIDETAIRAAIERVVVGTDPRLRAVRHYRRKLRAPVERAITYLMAKIATLPPAIEASRRGFVADPHLRAVFASPEQLQETLSFSPQMQPYLRRSIGSRPPELYAAIRAERIERNTLGIVMQGDQLRRDVPQVVVLFQDYRAAFPNTDEADTRRELMDRMFGYLIGIALQHLISLRAHRQELEQHQRHLLQTKAGVLKSAGLGLGSLVGELTSSPPDRAAVERQLEEINAELDRMSADTATLDDHLALVAETLSEPERHFRLDEITLTLDHMNVRVEPGSAQVSNTLTFREIRVGSQRFIVLLVKFPSGELLEQPDFFKEAQRLLFLNDQPRLTV